MGFFELFSSDEEWDKIEKEKKEREEKVVKCPLKRKIVGYKCLYSSPYRGGLTIRYRLPEGRWGSHTYQKSEVVFLEKRMEVAGETCASIQYRWLDWELVGRNGTPYPIIPPRL